MKSAFDPIAAAATEAARATLPEQVQVGAITPLPRGADPFVGAERPLLMAATRWTLVAPGGVLLGGAPAAMAAILGFEVPARPAPVAPEDRRPEDPPPPKWSDLLADAARETATTVTQAIASAIAPVADLPPDCSATQVSVSDDEGAIRAEVGPIPDAVVVTLHADEHEVRLVVVVPGIMVARLGFAQEPAAPAAPPAPEPGTDEASAVAPSTALRAELDRALAAVPLDLAIGMGHANVPLAHVLHLQDGEVLELEEAVDAPVDLVSDGTRVAFGDLEVSDHGTLVLHVTGIPGRPAAVSPPSLVAEPDLEPEPLAPSADPAPEHADGESPPPDVPAEADAPSGDAE